MRVSYGKLFTVSRVMTWTHLFNKGGGGNINSVAGCGKDKG